MENFNYRDSSGKTHSISLDEKEFEFAQKDETITDVKFKGKPVTFAKDAMIRFCKNKSSIVATVILGIMILLALILPSALPFDVTQTHADETFLAPKIFKAGTGFLDGTKKYKDVIYDESTGYPSATTKLDNNSILMDTLKVYDGYTNNVYSFAHNGYIRIANTSKDETASIATDTLSISSKSNVSLTFEIDSGLEPVNYGNSSYDVFINYAEGEETKSITVLKDSYQYDKVSIVLDDFIKDLPVNSFSVSFSVDPITNEGKAVFLKSLSVSDNGNTVYEFKDAAQALYNKEFLLNGADVSLFNAVIKYCSFSYDTYNAKYGDKNMVIGETQVKDYIKKGYMSYDFNVGPSSFKVLSEEKCPIKSVTKQTASEGLISVINLDCVVTYYKYLGYSKMPVHILGTNAQGKDMLKYVAEGTRNSLAIGVLIAFITFLFGMIYGAIEDYFGGTVDPVMEGIVDILGYIPWIVIVTLCVLHLGQNFGVFVLAMCLTGWISTSSITRTQFYRFKRREYVLASRSLGAKDTRLIFTHILPNSLGTIVTSSVLMIPSVIFSEASISYLGIGLKGLSSLGVILSDNQKYINSYAYLLIFPSVVLALMMICFNLFGNGLRDALNPSLKGSD